MKRREMLRLFPFTAAGIAGIYDSALAFGGPEKHGGKLASPDAMTYIDTVIEMLTWIRENQAENILEAAYAVARTARNGRTCWSHWDQGHTASADTFEGREGFPQIMETGYDVKKSKKGDMVLASFADGSEMIEDIAKKDIFMVGGPSPVSGDCLEAYNNIKNVRESRFRPNADIWIETRITSTGAVVQVPGSPAPLGPVSGPIYLTILWAILADASRVLSIEGEKVTVSGDSPKLKGDGVKWVSLADPLTDNLFATVIRQMKLLGSERGQMRILAEKAAATLVSGGSVYGYSRREESIATEWYHRRGGFGFPKMAHEGNIEGESGDMVIMGITEPDNPVDLKSMKAFRERGMKIASIGPVTDGGIPDGDTVPKLSDVHVGRSYDTQGIFAIPGIDRKVCPTSGIMNVTALWAASVEIAMALIRNTGNTPGIHYSGSLLWGGEHNGQMRQILNERGY